MMYLMAARNIMLSWKIQQIFKMKTNYDYIIGIDPDVDKSGFATWILNKKLRLEQHDLHDVFHTLLTLKDNCFVRLEAGHHVKST